MGYRWLGLAIVGVHFVALAYIVFGGFVALRWRWSIWVHLLFGAWAASIIAFATLLCPLTIAQNWARERGGQSPLVGGFIDQYVKGVLYPTQFTVVAQVLVAAVIITSWVLFYRGRDRFSHRSGDLRRA
ncbi:MAG TPA: DUF2784 domain-containing protein [Micromonosporaceae bacterium]